MCVHAVDRVCTRGCSCVYTKVRRRAAGSKRPGRHRRQNHFSLGRDVPLGLPVHAFDVLLGLAVAEADAAPPGSDGVTVGSADGWGSADGGGSADGAGVEATGAGSALNAALAVGCAAAVPSAGLRKTTKVTAAAAIAVTASEPRMISAPVAFGRGRAPVLVRPPDVTEPVGGVE